MCVTIYIAIAADINYVKSLISPNRQSWSWWCLLFSPTLLAQHSHFTTIRTLEQTEVITYNQLLLSMNPYRRRCLQTGIKGRKQQALQQACREHCLQTGIKGIGKSKHCIMHVDRIACKQAGKSDSLLHLCIMLRLSINIYVVSAPVCRKFGRVRISECLQSNRDEKKRRAPPYNIALTVNTGTPQKYKKSFFLSSVELLSPTTILLGLIPFFLLLFSYSFLFLMPCLQYIAL